MSKAIKFTPDEQKRIRALNADMKSLQGAADEMARAFQARVGKVQEGMTAFWDEFAKKHNLDLTREMWGTSTDNTTAVCLQSKHVMNQSEMDAMAVVNDSEAGQ